MLCNNVIYLPVFLSSTSLVTTLLDVRTDNWSPIYNRCREFPPSPQRPYRLRGQPSLLSSSYDGVFTRVRAVGAKIYCHD